ncbi:DUF4397 domain-containing protein [Hymenobacter wooponensis]|uniref:DUF4397 domain-containing protein n=1 Tax=Hymenobacter wooponensis TaxID=1525360 RepID=A0A4Z0MPF2_9BACT|nr:DUF4397 domain-containing protein [Hymenobacter wooponensis]TGD81404.1 DUF4397 domain-containing protein [Hymenobacter wooponensis]
MKTLTSLLSRSALLAALPAALAFSSCSDDKSDPTPEQGKVLLIHAAPSANARVKVLANDTELGQLDYGQLSNYVTVNTGTPSLKINDASSNQTVATKQATIEKDKSYSVFAYSPSTALGSADAIVVPDDLTAPSAGKAKIRLVHLGLGSPNTVSLAQPAALTGTVDIIPNVAFGTASSFVEITPSTYNLVISTGSGATASTEVTVGDGSGSGTGTKAYEAGKIYTVLVRGIKSASVATDLRTKAIVITNN